MFTLAIEPFAIATRSHPELTEIRVRPTEHWISLFADDVLLFWSNISKSMQMILEVIKLFSEVSGHKTNKAKSSILLLSANERASLLQDTMQFNAATQFRYLGIHI